MLKTVTRDLEDLCDAIEHLEATLPRLTMEEKVDLAARVCAIIKTSTRINDSIKGEIKKLRKGKIGYVVGDLFKAFVNVFPVTRLDQKKVEVNFPKVYAACLKTEDEQRVTFEAR